MTVRTLHVPFALTLLLTLTAWTLTGCDQGSNAPSTQTYAASLTTLNDSGVSGQAQITVEGDQLTIAIDADGAEAGQPHAQHIHGFADGGASRCPTAAADTSGDGRISVGEGAPSYGGIRVPLDGSLDTAEGLGDIDTFPTGDGRYTYRTSIATADLALNGGGTFDDLRLGEHAIVVHGATVDGDYAATLPVACGTLTRTN
jgi:Cu/Zn superoxide dismutase